MVSCAPMTDAYWHPVRSNGISNFPSTAETPIGAQDAQIKIPGTGYHSEHTGGHPDISMTATSTDQSSNVSIFLEKKLKYRTILRINDFNRPAGHYFYTQLRP
jgi:hypothetical protein